MKYWIIKIRSHILVITIIAIIVSASCRITLLCMSDALNEEYDKGNMKALLDTGSEIEAMQNKLKTAILNNVQYSVIINYNAASLNGNDAEKLHTMRAVSNMLANIEQGGGDFFEALLYSKRNDTIITSEAQYSRKEFEKRLYQFELDNLRRQMDLPKQSTSDRFALNGDFVYYSPDDQSVHNSVLFGYIPGVSTGESNSAILLLVDKTAITDKLDHTRLADNSGSYLFDGLGVNYYRNDAAFLDSGFTMREIFDSVLRSGKANGVLDLGSGNGYEKVYYDKLKDSDLIIAKVTKTQSLQNNLDAMMAVAQWGHFVLFTLLLIAYFLLFSLVKYKKRWDIVSVKHTPKEMVLNTLLGNRTSSAKNCEADFKILKLDIYSSQKLVLLFQLDDYYELYGSKSSSEAQFMHEEIASLLHEKLHREYDVHFIMTDIVAVMLFTKRTNFSAISLQKALEETQLRVWELYHKKISFSVGPKCKHYRELSNSYQKALSAFKQRIFFDDSVILGVDDIPSNKRETFVMSELNRTRITDVLINSVFPGDYKIIEQLFDDLFRIKHVTYSFIIQICLSVVQICASCLDENKKVADVRFSYDVILSNLLHCRHIDQLKEILKQYCTYVNSVSRLEPNGEGGISMHVSKEKLIEYIARNYFRDISLSEMADAFGFSPAYFSKLFKHLTGMNAIDFLHSYRMKEAEKLINGDKHLKTKDIASMVGYNSYKTFSRQYKKFFGVTPNTR